MSLFLRPRLCFWKALSLLSFLTFCSFDSYEVPSTLCQIPGLYTPCSRVLQKTWFLRVIVHTLQQSLCTPSKGKFRAISSELQNRNRFHQCTPCIRCALLAFDMHTLHCLNRRETIETYTNIHSFIHS
jgi:hypothetical protein